MAAERVCPVDELTTNEAVRVVIDGTPIALVKDSTGTCHAIGDTCTHGDISLAEGFVDGDALECWAHGSKFSLTTGIPQNLPAFEPVPVYELTVVDGDVYIDPQKLIDPTTTKENA